MCKFRNTGGTIAMAMLLAALGVSSGFAKQRAAQDQDWRNARAQAIPDSDITLGGSRAAAIRTCNDKAAPLRDYTWGDEQIQSYRSCMSEHGQAE
jgi:hypothetical protein